MAATGIGNPAGYVPIFDGGNPRIIGGLARGTTVSGGVLVFASGATGVVSSGANSFATSDLLFAIDASGLAFNGVAVQSAGSNQPLAVATRGSFLLACNGTVVAGQPVRCDGNNAVAPLAGSPTIINQVGHAIGRALTGGASGGYAVIDINA